MKELNSILKSIKNKDVLPIYFFHGEEPYFIDLAVKGFEQDFLDEDDKAFNQTVVYGKDTSYLEILSLARQFPMMGTHQLIIVKEAQDLKLNEEESKALEQYIQNPVLSTVLVIAHKHKKIDARKKFIKLLDKNSLVLSEPVKDYAIPKWIAEECKNLQIKTAPNISILLAEYLGADLSRIANELTKLKMILKEDEILDGAMIEKHIGISKEFNVFELQKALGAKDAEKSYKISHFMGKNAKNNPFPKVTSNLYFFFSNVLLYHTVAHLPAPSIASTLKINPYFVTDFAMAAKMYPIKSTTRVLSVLREFDMKSKGVGGIYDHEDLFKEMVYKILNIHLLKIKV